MAGDAQRTTLVIVLPTAELMTPEETYLGAPLGCLEGIRSGTTAMLVRTASSAAGASSRTAASLPWSR